MLDHGRADLEGIEAEVSIEEAIEFCLRKMDEDKAHTVGQEIVKGLTFYEVIGALILARDAVNAFETMEQARADRATFARMLPASPLSQ